MKKLIALLILLLAIIVPYWWAIKDLQPIDAAARANAPGEFAELDDGQIHYQWSGAATGKVIVLVHGFSTPSFVFNQNATALAGQGFRVLQFDHFGRGWSDRPSAKYDADFYDRELIQLFDHLGIDQKVGLVGYSMGGIITAEFTARHPERVASLFLLAPAGLAVDGGDGFAQKVINTPVIGDWVWTIFGRSILTGDGQYDETGLPEGARLHGDVEEQMGYKGYFPALLSTLRHLGMRDREETFSRLAKTGVPVTALFGSEDATVPPENAKKLKVLIPTADVSDVDGGDHGFPYKLSGKVNPLLAESFGLEAK